jgi:signal transduction histidine kinase
VQIYPLPSNEAERLRALEDLCILATRAEPHFDAVVTLARKLLDVPVAFIAFQDQQNQWFKAHSGISVDAPTRDLAICNYTLLGDCAFVVPDLAVDERFADMPYVTGEPYLRFYAGMPLALQQGLPLGTLCVMDTRVRDLAPGELDVLEQLAQIVVSFLRHQEAELARSAAEAANERLQLEAQLRQAQKMEVVGQLTGGIAHDFNNLLTVVIGNTEMISDESGDPIVKSLASMALEAAERGADLTHKLLAFSRRQSLTPERLCVEDVVQQMEPLLRRTLGEHIDLQMGRTGEPHCAWADRSSFDSALLNLVVNARDAMPHGGTLTITAGAQIAGPGGGALAGRPAVFVTVSDTGTGMSPEVLERAFEPFFTTKEVGKGTGLGLSMVYGFAQQSGGHVSIESQPGQGTSVTILLPELERTMAHPTSLDTGSPAPVRGREKVLVVEDEPQVLAFVASQLEGLGYDVTGVASGRDALEALNRDQSFDLLFTDVVLPHGMSGVDLARHVQEMGLHTKVLLTSGYSEEVFEQHGRPDESTLLLRKPYRRKELAETLRKALEPSA